MPNLPLDACLQDLPLHAATLDMTCSGAEAIALFADNPTLPGILLLRDRQLVGLISRQHFFEAISRLYGQDLYARRSLQVFYNCNPRTPLILEAETSVATAAALTLQRPLAEAYEPIAVSFPNGSYQLLSTHDLLRAHAEIYQLTADRLREQTNRLEHLVDDLHQTQTQLIQAEKMSALGQMVAGIAHEINNPISFVYCNIAHVQKYSQDLLALVSLYQRHYPTPHGEIQEAIEEIDLEFLSVDLERTISSMHLGASRVQEIVRSLRTFSRLDEAQIKTVCLHEGLDSTLLILQNRLRAQSDRPEIRVSKQYGDIPPIECYAGQINQVFLNLLSNAIDAVSERHRRDPHLEPRIEIATSLQTRDPDAPRVVIRIADNGIGMSPEVRQKLFTPFFTTKPVGQGTGLGLAISYSIIVDKHGGRIDYQSEPGVGTAFCIELPLALSPTQSLAS